MRQTGILMPVFSLPSKSGIGELGEAAYHWIDIMEKTGMKIWQILPLNPVGYGNSPYQPYSSYAGDELYISLEELWKEGLLAREPSPFREYAGKVDYDGVREWKLPHLKEAWKTFREKSLDETSKFRSFAEQKWVQEYGVFRALKRKNGGVCWNEWEEADKNWISNPRELTAEEREEADFQIFLQYLFYFQWMKVKETANAKGIRIMGDVPFYVGVDSVDVWGGKDQFLLDTDGRPIFIAGVPPDYFSATGQRWGNPIYDWDHMKEDHYRFWLERIGYSGKLFDIVRIDHFRAFDTYWKIPSSCPTAMEGEWIEAPGYEVLDLLTRELPEVELVAEDLGELRPEVLTLKDHYHLKGMKILVFSIDSGGKYARDINADKENMILYTGTHDNDTLMEWYHHLNCASRRKIRRFLKKEGCGSGSVKDRLLAYTLKSKASYVILPVQDILGLGEEGHMNTPGTVGSPNWEWRMPSFEEIERAMKEFGTLVRKYRPAI